MERKQEEMQFLGLWGIYKESFKIIISSGIFRQITVALIFPLSSFALSQTKVFLLFMSYYNTKVHYQTMADSMVNGWATMFLFQLVYLTFLLVFSLLSTSTVVYTFASIYTGRQVSFKKVMSAVPKVSKRLMITILCTFLAFLAYILVLMLVFILWLSTVGYSSKVSRDIFVVAMVIYMAGYLYMIIIWQLSSVVSVLEDFKGFKAMVKSKDLIKGKKWIAAVILFKLTFCSAAIQQFFNYFVVFGQRGQFVRSFVGLLCLYLLSELILFGLVVQTVFYFVCKSYHHENIDKSTLSDRLDVYVGDYVPLQAKDVHLEHFDV